jgi:hypothetical protein
MQSVPNDNSQLGMLATGPLRDPALTRHVRLGLAGEEKLI